MDKVCVPPSDSKMLYKLELETQTYFIPAT